MMPSREQVFSVLREFNPWWSGSSPEGLPTWRRSAFGQLKEAIIGGESRRAVLLGGARQVGKTTLFRQVIVDLVDSGIPAASIAYISLDHPILRLAGLDTVIQTWEEGQPPPEGSRYIFVDEVQHHADWQTWVKHQVDFHPRQRIGLTGSAFRIAGSEPESALGRIARLRLPTLSFFEFLRMREIQHPDVPPVRSIGEIGVMRSSDRLQAVQACRALNPLFHEYLLRGGFPGSLREGGIESTQRRLREDIVEVALKRDMTAIFGVRNVQQLDKVFLYLCFNDGGILSPTSVSSSLGIKAPTLQNFLAVLEASHLIHRLRPYGYGKQVLRAKEKVYVADPAIPGAIMLRGRSLIEDAGRLGMAVENAVFKHVANHDLGVDVEVSYWQNSKHQEVDLVARTRGVEVPFEVKYRTKPGTESLEAFCAEHAPERAYLVTRDADTLGVSRMEAAPKTQLLSVPAPLLCYWLGRIELARSLSRGQTDW